MLKWRIDGPPYRFKRELEILQLLQGVPGVVKLIDFAHGVGEITKDKKKKKKKKISKEEEIKQPKYDVLILEYLEESTVRFFELPSELMLKDYFRQLLKVCSSCRLLALALYRCSCCCNFGWIPFSPLSIYCRC